MKKRLWILLLLFAVVTARGDTTFEPVQVGDLVRNRPGGEASATCYLQYYNLCSGWLNIWSGFEAGDMVGTVFDVPFECTSMQHTSMFVNWVVYDVMPNYGHTVDIEMYVPYEDLCLYNPPVVGVYDLDFPSGPAWWDVSGLVGFWGSLAFTMCWDTGIYPTIATDSPKKNFAAPNLCSGFVPEAHTYYFRESGAELCPPVVVTDGTYDLNMIADMTIYATSKVEATSWGAIKSLFR